MELKGNIPCWKGDWPFISALHSVSQFRLNASPMALTTLETTLETIFQLSPTVRTFRLRLPEPASFQAGQFCMVHVPRDGKFQKKAYSICSSPFETGYLDLCIKLVEGGMATTWFWSLKEGDKLTVTLPYGAFLIKEEEKKSELVFVATGTGLAPLRCMIRDLVHEGFQQPMTLIFGVRYEDELIYADEFRELEKTQKNFKYIPTISRPKNTPQPWTGEVGYVQDKLKKFVSDPAGKRVYVCGLVPMIEGVQKAAEEIGFDKKSVHFEKYV